jgi:hypothetical protein
MTYRDVKNYLQLLEVLSSQNDLVSYHFRLKHSSVS